MCSLQVSFASMCSPRYRTDGEFGIVILLKRIGRLRPFLNVNVTCVDLVSFTLIFHCSNVNVKENLNINYPIDTAVISHTLSSGF